MIGSTLAHYRITAQIGKGRMGEAYQAKDQKLGREAIKVLPEEFARDHARMPKSCESTKTLRLRAFEIWSQLDSKEAGGIDGRLATMLSHWQ